MLIDIKVWLSPNTARVRNYRDTWSINLTLIDIKVWLSLNIAGVRNYRDTWNINLTEPIASNFYPVTSRIVMYDKEDQHSAFAVLNDRSQVHFQNEKIQKLFCLWFLF